MAKKNELYNQLRTKVQSKGGFVRIKTFERPCVLLRGEETDREVVLAALLVSDNNSPLKLITNRFTAWNVGDCLKEEDIDKLLNLID